MPQRFLKPGITNSKKWNRIPWPAQSLYIRLITLVDDYGRHEADPELLRSIAFPYGDPEGNPLTVDNICEHLRAIADKNLVVLYEVDGKEYLQLVNWQERPRSASKCPEPPKSSSANNCSQMLAPSSSSSPSSSPSPTPMRESAGKHEDPREPVLDTVWGTLVSFYKRPNGIRSYEEESTLADVCRRPGAVKEAQILMRYYELLPKEERRYFPQSACRLLEKWQQTLDRARQYQPPAKERTI